MPPESSQDSASEVIRTHRVDNAIALRRKLNFWRRASLLLFGLALLVLLVAWQRGETSRIECAEALTRYAETAKDQQLDSLAPELVGVIWRGFDASESRRYPQHYLLFNVNWARPFTDAPIPLAVCEHSHSTLFRNGRNVLYRTKSGLVVKWVSESEAAALAILANRADPRP